MTILAGFSSSRQGTAPLKLAAQIAHCTGEPIVAAAVVERPWPPRADPIEDEYLGYVTSEAEKALKAVVETLPEDLNISVVIHQATSIPTGLLELATKHGAELVVVGSSTSGLMGRVTLGSVTERLVHTAAVPVAIAPRGYQLRPDRIMRLTAAYGGDADINGLIPAAAALRKEWSTKLRVASFTVRPRRLFGGSMESSAEDLVVKQWAARLESDVAEHLSRVRERIDVPDVELVIGRGTDWNDAVESVRWEPGDLLLLGSGAAGQSAQVFLGSAASKILRHASVPVLIVPRYQLTR